MFNYFKKKHILNHILNILRIDYGMNIYPNLTFNYTLDDNVLTLVLPSKDQYIFSPFEEELTITYDRLTEKVKFSADKFDVAGDSGLLRHLRKCVNFLEKRNEFHTMIYNERQKMAQYIDPKHRQGGNAKRDKDGNVYSDFVYAASDDSSNSGGHDSSHDHHSNHHNDN
jgi:hypothetical protein